jgi:hypothetical protein
MDVEGQSTAENVAADLLGVVKSQVRSDLEPFKQLIEKSRRRNRRLPGRGAGGRNEVGGEQARAGLRGFKTRFTPRSDIRG